MMNNFRQQQAPLPPTLQNSPQVAAYQQYGSSATMGTGSDGMVAYPTTHLYQNQNQYLCPSQPSLKNIRFEMNYFTDWNNCTHYYNAYQCGMAAAAPPTPPPISDPVTKAVVDNILGKLPTKKSQIMHRCDICEQDFSGRSVLDTHLAGAKHAKKLKSMDILNQLAASGQNFSQGGPGGNLRCEACGIDANSSQQLQTHLAGNKHKQKVQKLVQTASAPAPATATATTASTLMPPPAPPASLGVLNPCASTPPAVGTPIIGPVAPPGAITETKQFFCEFCNCYLNSSVQMQQHTESRKHKDKANGKTHSNKHHPYRRVPPARFQQPSRNSGKKKKQPIAFMTPLSSSFVPGSML